MMTDENENRFLQQVRGYNTAESQQERDLILFEVGLDSGLIPQPALTDQQRRIVRYYMRQCLDSQGLKDVGIRE
jgi:hypothetical protein